MNDHQIDSAAELRERYRDPSPQVRQKLRPVVDAKAAEFVAASPLFVLATTSQDGTDASPRGGEPGFVRVLDPSTVAFADLAGNNLLDSYGNIVEHAAVGMLFFVPGSEETLRINGRASITTDPDVLEATAFEGKRPKVAVVVDVDECYVHCAKALRRSRIWEPESWGAAAPSAGEILVDQLELGIDPQIVDDGLESDYAATIWNEGGR